MREDPGVYYASRMPTFPGLTPWAMFWRRCAA